MHIDVAHLSQSAQIERTLKTIVNTVAAEQAFATLRASSVNIDKTLENDLFGIIAAYQRTAELLVEFQKLAKTLEPNNKDKTIENVAIRNRLALFRDNVLQNEAAARATISRRKDDGFLFETWEAWKNTQKAATAVATYYANIEKLIVVTAEQSDLTKIDMEIARSERLKRFIGESERAEVRLQEVLNNISTLGVKSKALQQDAEAWQEKINQAERVVQRLNEKIPGSGLIDEKGELGDDLNIYEILSSVDTLTAKFRAHESELTSLKSDWSALEKQAKVAEKAIKDAQVVQSRVTPAYLAEKKSDIDAALAKLAPIEEKARVFSAAVAVIKKNTDTAEKDIKKASTDLTTLEERLETLTASESTITTAALQMQNFMTRPIPNLFEEGHQGDSAFQLTVARMRELAVKYKTSAANFQPTMKLLEADWKALEKDAEANEKIAIKVGAQMVRFDEPYFSEQRDAYAGTQARFIQTKKNFDQLLLEANKVDTDLAAVKKTLDAVDKLERGIAAAQERLNATADERKAKFDVLREKQRALDTDLRTEAARSAEIRSSLSEHTDKIRALDTDTARQRENLRRARTELDAIERDTSTLDKDYNAAVSRTQKLDASAQALERKAERAATTQRTAAARIEVVAALSDTDMVRAEARYSAIETRTDAITGLLNDSKEKATAAKSRQIELVALESEVKGFEERVKVADRSIVSSIARITASITSKAQSSKQLDSVLTQLEKIQQMLLEYLVRLRIVEPGGAAPAPAYGAGATPMTSKELAKLSAAGGSSLSTIVPVSHTTVAPVFQTSSTTTPTLRIPMSGTATSSTSEEPQFEIPLFPEAVLRSLASEVEIMGGYKELRANAEQLIESFTKLFKVMLPPEPSSEEEEAAPRPSFEEVLALLVANAQSFDDVINKAEELEKAAQSASGEIETLQGAVALLNERVGEQLPIYEAYVGKDGAATKALAAARELRANINKLTADVKQAITPPAGAAQSIAALDNSVVALTRQVDAIDAQRASADGMLNALTKETARISDAVRAKTAELAVLDRASAELQDALTQRRNALIVTHGQLYELNERERLGVAVVDAAEFEKVLVDLDRSKLLVLDLARTSGWLLPPEQDKIARQAIDYKFVVRDEERKRVAATVAAAAAARQEAETATLKERMTRESAQLGADNSRDLLLAETQFTEALATETARGGPVNPLDTVAFRFEKLSTDNRLKPEEQRTVVYDLVLGIISRRRKAIKASQREEEAEQRRQAEALRLLQQQQQQPVKTTTTTVTSSTSSTPTSRTTKPSGRGRGRSDDDDDDDDDDEPPIADRLFTKIEMIMSPDRRARIMAAWRSLQKVEKKLASYKRRKIDLTSVEAEQKRAKEALKIEEDAGNEEAVVKMAQDEAAKKEEKF
jgi:hypothetical protein